MTFRGAAGPKGLTSGFVALTAPCGKVLAAPESRSLYSATFHRDWFGARLPPLAEPPETGARQASPNWWLSGTLTSVFAPNGTPRDTHRFPGARLPDLSGFCTPVNRPGADSDSRPTGGRRWRPHRPHMWRTLWIRPRKPSRGCSP